MAELTVEEKRKILIEHCDKMHEGESNCYDCPLLGKCLEISNDVPNYMNDTEITRLFSKFEKLKGEPTMNEQAVTIEQTPDYITIPVSEYRFLISEQATLSKLEGYAETHEYLSDDVVRALLGVEKPAANLESEGD